MITITYLLYFILGMCFIQFCLPIGDSIVSLIITYIEFIKSHLNVTISSNNKLITDIRDNLVDYNEKSQNLIGFQIDDTPKERSDLEND